MNWEHFTIAFLAIIATVLVFLFFWFLKEIKTKTKELKMLSEKFAKVPKETELRGNLFMFYVALFGSLFFLSSAFVALIKFIF